MKEIYERKGGFTTQVNFDISYNELPNISELSRFKPDVKWGRRSNRAEWKDHGDGHIARLLVMYYLLRNALEKTQNIHLKKEENAAIILSIITHDLRSRHDLDSVLYHPHHEKKAAKKKWLGRIYNELSERSPDIFEKKFKNKVLQISSMINRVHDETDEKKVLKILQKKYRYKEQELPLTIKIFKDLDSSLERLRLLYRIGEIPFFGKMILKTKQIKKATALIREPYFQATKTLQTEARLLYFKSVNAPGFRRNQWHVAMNISAALNLSRSS